VGHSEVHGVRPERRVGQGCSDRRIVQESLFLHHGELVVAAHAQIRRPQTDDAVVCQIGVLFGDYAHTGHFLGPVLDGGVAPELFVVVVPVTRQYIITNVKDETSEFYTSSYYDIFIGIYDGGREQELYTTTDSSGHSYNLGISVIIMSQYFIIIYSFYI